MPVLPESLTARFEPERRRRAVPGHAVPHRGEAFRTVPPERRDEVTIGLMSACEALISVSTRVHLDAARGELIQVLVLRPRKRQADRTRVAGRQRTPRFPITTEISVTWWLFMFRAPWGTRLALRHELSNGLDYEEQDHPERAEDEYENGDGLHTISLIRLRTSVEGRPGCDARSGTVRVSAFRGRLGGVPALVANAGPGAGSAPEPPHPP